MAEPTIPNGEEYFFPIIYEGNGDGQRVGKFVPFTDNGTIANSVIFNDGDSPYLTRTPSSAGNRRTATLSLWFKRSDTGADSTLFSIFDGSNNLFTLQARNNTSVSGGGTANFCIQVQARLGSSTTRFFRTNRSFKDTSKFYHILLKIDTTDGTESNRVRLYVDGDEITDFSSNDLTSGNNLTQNTDLIINNTNLHSIGAFENSGSYSSFADGYLAEVNWIDGTAYGPETFGVTDTSTGRWVPKTLSGITYGTNGFRLTFQNNDAVANLGYDYQTSDRSTTNDFSVTNLATTDQTTDSPTQNHATFDSGRNGGDWTLSEGNLKIVGTPSTGAGRICLSGMNVPNSNKIYWEVEGDAMNDAPRYLGIFRDSVSLTAGSSTEDMRYISIRAGGTHDGKVWDGRFTSSQLTTFSAGDIIQFARDGEKLWIGKNDNWLNSGNPSTGANPLLTNIDTKSNWKMGVYSVSTGSPSGTSHTFIANTGQRTFSYTPPTGFSAWQQDNLPETAKGVSGLVWAKSRDNTGATLPSQLVDSSRGVGKRLISSGTNTEAFDSNHLTKFLKGGYATGDINVLNTAGDSMVAWNWVANAGTTESISAAGDIDIASTVQKNTTAGFSIVQWTGNNASTAGIGHGLSAAPEWILIKNMSDTTDWWVYHHKFTADQNAKLNDTIKPGSFVTGKFDYSEIDATKFEVASGGTNANSVNGSGDSMIAYCWHGVDGFSKFGKYNGNGHANGPFIYTGFLPAWIMFKEIGNNQNWPIWDGARFISNPTNNSLFADLTQGDNGSSIDLDVLSNGFKPRTTNTQINRSTGVYAYMAFAKNPFNGDGTSFVTAR